MEFITIYRPYTTTKKLQPLFSYRLVQARGGLGDRRVGGGGSSFHFGIMACDLEIRCYHQVKSVCLGVHNFVVQT